MLGGLLSRQAEEEERQLREAEQHEEDSNHACVVSPSDGTDAQHIDVVDSLTGSSSIPTNRAQYGSLVSLENHNQVVGSRLGDGLESESGRYTEDAYEDHSDLEGEYSYDDDESDGEYDDDELLTDGSSIEHDDNEESSYLLRRRRNKRRKKKKKEQTTWKRFFQRIGSKIRSAVVAIADVDNVWDSPDTAAQQQRAGVVAGGGGAYAEDPSASGLNSIDENENRTSTIIYNVITGGTSTRNRTAAIFWFICLSTSYASERSTFKLLVDRVGPFRLFSAELILGAHALLTGLGMFLGRMIWRKEKKEYEMEKNGGGFGLGLPLADVGLMAVLDTVYLLLGVISGAHVPPVLTVVLVQTTIPLTACFTQCVHPDGHWAGRGACVTENEEVSPGGNSSAATSHSNVRIISNSPLNEINDFPDISSIPNLPAPTPPPVKGWGGLSRYHIIGTGLMFLAIFLGLTPAVLSLDHIVITKKDAMPDRTAYNTLVFCAAAIPAAMSQLYKEHTLTRLKQPIDRNTLNMVLSIFQLLFAILVAPLAYGLQGMGDGPGWTTLFPSKQIGENFSHGLECFFGTLDEETMKTGYPEQAECNWSAALVLGHVLSIMMVGVAIDKLAAATKVMYRGVSMGIIFAVILMFIYQIRDQWCEYGPLVSFFHLTSVAILIVGAEIYHRVSLVDASFETVYPEIGDLYDEEE